MKKDVIISIKSIEKNDEDPEILEFVTEGRLYDHGNSFYLRYMESEITGMLGTTTVLRVDPEPRLTLTRSGSVTTQLTFEKNKRNVSAFSIPEGTIQVGVRAFELESTLNETGGSIKLGYTVELDSRLTAIHSLELLVKEKSENKNQRISEKVEQ